MPQPVVHKHAEMKVLTETMENIIAKAVLQKRQKLEKLRNHQKIQQEQQRQLQRQLHQQLQQQLQLQQQQQMELQKQQIQQQQQLQLHSSLQSKIGVRVKQQQIRQQHQQIQQQQIQQQLQLQLQLQQQQQHVKNTLASGLCDNGSSTTSATEVSMKNPIGSLSILDCVLNEHEEQQKEAESKEKKYSGLPVNESQVAIDQDHNVDHLRHQTKKKVVLPEKRYEKFSIAVSHDIDEIVSRAASLVTAEIVSGIWRHTNYTDLNHSAHNNTGKMKVEKSDGTVGLILNMHDTNKLKSFAASLEEFASKMIVPSLVSSGVGEARCDSDDPSEIAQFNKHRDDRVFVSALLNLRELLILNADEIFSLPSFRYANDGIERHNGMAIEENTFRSYLLSTSLILTGLERLGDKAAEENLLKLFRDAVKKYDSSHEEFASCLKRLDSCSLGVTPSGRVLSREENIAWRVSYNLCRESHPLIKKQKSPGGPQPPSDNACFISVIEERQSTRDPLSARRNKMEDESYVLEKHRGFMDRCLKAYTV